MCQFANRRWGLFALFILVTAMTVQAQNPPGEGPALGSNRITQAEIENNLLSLLEIRRAGRNIFSTPFNKLDGFGDGPIDPNNPIAPGGRPTLGDNGSHLRINGLDSQSCLECHGILSSATIPSKFGVGGVGGSSANVLAGPTQPIDPVDGFFNGRFINPPFVFGSGGVELLGKEMTIELQDIKNKARQNPGVLFNLVVKGVDFGTLRYDHGQFDTSGIEGIDEDLVVRPFGRKGEFITTREFDQGAFQFHFGMQPVEIVGENIDDDGDGVVNEILVGEMSAVAIFNTTSERPVQDQTGSRNGFQKFMEIGCGDCHKPALFTKSRYLTHSFPEEPTDPTENVFYKVDLTMKPTGFKPVGNGIEVPLFADLKRHDMGPGLAENTGGALDPFFTTARLWGVADTAPYLHDGRALTLTDAILAHGGEGQQARDAFDGLSNQSKREVLSFLRSLRTPNKVGDDL